MKPKAFNFYLDYIINIEILTDEEVGQLVRSLLHYANTGEVPKMSKIVKVAFAPMRRQMDIEFGNYEAKCQKMSENAQKRWEQKDTNGCKPMQLHTNGYKGIQNENENKNENKKENIKRKNPFRKVTPYIERDTPSKPIGMEYINGIHGT